MYCVFEQIKGFAFNQREGEEVKTFTDTLQQILHCCRRESYGGAEQFYLGNKMRRSCHVVDGDFVI